MRVTMRCERVILGEKHDANRASRLFDQRDLVAGIIHYVEDNSDYSSDISTINTATDIVPDLKSVTDTKSRNTTRNPTLGADCERFLINVYAELQFVLLS